VCLCLCGPLPQQSFPALHPLTPHGVVIHNPLAFDVHHCEAPMGLWGGGGREKKGGRERCRGSRMEGRGAHPSPKQTNTNKEPSEQKNIQANNCSKLPNRHRAGHARTLVMLMGAITRSQAKTSTAGGRAVHRRTLLYLYPSSLSCKGKRVGSEPEEKERRGGGGRQGKPLAGPKARMQQSTMLDEGLREAQPADAQGVCEHETPSPECRRRT
jgi:hypothetical protein